MNAGLKENAGDARWMPMMALSSNGWPISSLPGPVPTSEANIPVNKPVPGGGGKEVPGGPGLYPEPVKRAADAIEELIDLRAGDDEGRGDGNQIADSANDDPFFTGKCGAPRAKR